MGRQDRDLVQGDVSVILSGSYRKTCLDNGLRVVSEHVPYVRSISLGIWVQVGSRDEQSPERGLSHFLEHMLFKGTRKRNTFDIAHSLESLGGGLDAFTSRDLTCFYARCLDEHAEVALDVLADMLQSSVLDPKEIEKEKRVVLEEIQNVEDTPDDLIHDLFAKSVWGHHPVGEPILGTPDSVMSFTRQGLKGYLERHYVPGRMVIAAAGNLDHERLVDLTLGFWDSAASRVLPLQRIRPDNTGHSKQHYRRDIGQTHICLGTTACSYTHPRRFDQLVANTALGEGMSSRLFQQIRERLGLAYSVYSYLEMLEDTGLFGTYMACDSARVDRAIEIAYAELVRLKQDGISPRELESSKAQLRGELILGCESMDKRMGRLAQQEIYTGRYMPVEASLEAIGKVRQEGVLEACQTLLKEDCMHQVTVGP